MPSLPRCVALEIGQDSSPNLGMCDLMVRGRSHYIFLRFSMEFIGCSQLRNMAWIEKDL